MVEALTAQDLADVVGGYRLSAAVFAMADLAIPDLLIDAPQSAEALASACGVDTPILRRLLRLLASRGALIEEMDGRFSNTGLSASLVSGHQRDMVLGWSGLGDIVAAWGSLAPAMRSGRSPFEFRFGAGFHEHLARHPSANTAYATAMGATVESFDAIAAALDLSAYSTVVSVGGGQGQELVSILRRWPHLRAVLVDLPAALEGADTVLQQFGVADRVRIEPGDARTQLPPADAYLMSTVLRCLDDADATAVLAACRRAGTPNMRVFVVEMPLLDGAAVHPSATADMTAWVVYGGADRTIAQWTAIHAHADLDVTDVVPLNEPFSLLTSRPR